MKDFIRSSTFGKIIVILGILLAVLLIFSAGMSVGYYRANFAYRWGANYMHNMDRFERFLGPFMHDEDNLNTHGAIGTITSVDLPSFVVNGPNQAEQIIIVGSSTAIRIMRSQASTTDLKIGEGVVVIGEPLLDGRIQASFIRIMPLPLAATSSSLQ